MGDGEVLTSAADALNGYGNVLKGDSKALNDDGKALKGNEAKRRCRCVKWRWEGVKEQ